MTDAEQLLESDHREIDVLLEKCFDAVSRSDRERTLEAVDMVWARLAVHIRAEHLRLFPLIEGLAGAEQLEKLHADHEMFMHQLARAMKVVRGAPDDETWIAVRASLDAVAERLAQHNDLEEKLIYPAIDQLDSIVATTLSNELRRELRNMPPRLFASGNATQTDH